MPVRIQRKRTKGWRMPENTVYVGRPSWDGNPFIIGRDAAAIIGDSSCKFMGVEPSHVVRDQADAVDLYRRRWLANYPDGPQRAPSIKALRGHDLCCWCAIGDPCHADVLLELANS